MKFVYIVFLFACSWSAFAQDAWEVELQDRSWFTDRVATAMVRFDRVVEYEEGSAEGGDGCSVLDVEIREAPGTSTSRSIAIIRFLPTRVGRVTFPALGFISGETRLKSSATSLFVDEPKRSEAMALRMVAAKRRVHVGEPVRVDMTWDCSIHAGKLKALRLYPAVFNDPDIEVVVPRNTIAEENQLGLPIGGRRVIAKRILDTKAHENLGRVELSFYLRFSSPGEQTLSATRLECSILEKANLGFANYAAYFNNSLFDATDPEDVYRRIYTEAPAMEFEVLPLPESERPVDFSGLFAPLEISASIIPTEVEIGELMELSISLNGEAPHGMLELPEVSDQPGLRERFLVDPTVSRIWQESGTLFRFRVRALTTSIQALPSLKFHVFNPTSGRFETRMTEPIPLDVAPVDGKEFLPLKDFGGATIKLTSQPDGIWHNLDASPMNDFLDSMVALANQYFWLLLLLSPLAFLLLLPVVRERRRRAKNARYRLSAQAYGTFKRETDGSKEKWAAFVRWLAVSFESNERSWTVGDSRETLKSLGVDSQDIEEIVRMHETIDAADFGHERNDLNIQKLGMLAERLRPLVYRGLFAFALLALCSPSSMWAGDWDDAQDAFERAMAEPVGSERATILLQEAALKYEAAGEAGDHSGEAWYNAGNAWFESGNLGRSIAAYRRGQILRPFDPLIRENLAVARAFVRSDVLDTRSWWVSLPVQWLKPLLILLNLVFWLSLLLAIRFGGKARWSISACVGGLGLALGVLIMTKTIGAEPEGVIVADAVEARKGPGYNYALAFNEALRGGLEFRKIETRSDWVRIELSDAKQCWVPATQLQILE